MKKVFILLVLFTSIFGFAQKPINEGVIISKQTLSSKDDQVNMQLAMVGQIITTTWFKNDKSRSEMSNPMIGNSIVVIDMAINKMLMMKDNAMIGKKYVLKDLSSSESQIENLSVLETAETKTILGYVCKKYEVTLVKNGKGTEMTLYTTDKITAKSPQVISLGNLITGYPMLIEMKMSQMGAEILGSMEATSIVSEEISTTKFDTTPLEGYEKTDQLEM
jgi:hypothetical protein